MNKVVKVKDIATQLRGVSYAKEDASYSPSEGLVPILRANNITEQGLNFEGLVYVPKSCVKDKQLIKKGDVVIAASSGSIQVVGKAAYAENNFHGSFGAFCKVLRPDSSVDSKYFSYFFQTSFYRSTISSLAAGANINNLKNEHLDDFEIPLPPLAEQRHIARVLDAADQLRQQDRQLLAHYEQLVQAVFVNMFGDPVRNEKGWIKQTLKDVCLKITDGTHFSPPSADASGVPYITAKHLKKHGLDFYRNPTYVSLRHHKEIYSRCAPAKGDVLYIKDGATTGIAAINHYDFEFSMLSSLALLKLNKSKINNYYLVAWLNNEKVKEYLLNQSMAGAAIQRFTLQKINRFSLPIPSIDLQNRFAAIVEQIEAQKAAVQQLQQNSETLFNSLLQQAFRGELTPRVDAGAPKRAAQLVLGL